MNSDQRSFSQYFNQPGVGFFLELVSLHLSVSFDRGMLLNRKLQITNCQSEEI